MNSDAEVRDSFQVPRRSGSLIRQYAAGSVADAAASNDFRLIVSDTSPLLTLSPADSLDALLRAGLPVSILDAVYVAATHVRIVPTDRGIDQQRCLAEGRSIRGLANRRPSRC